MKKGTNRNEKEQDADFEFGPLFTQQKVTLFQRLDEIMKKKYANLSHLEQLQTILHEQLEDSYEENHELLIDQLFEECLWPGQFQRKFLKLIAKGKNQIVIFIMMYLILEGYFDKKIDNFETTLIEQANPKLLTNYFIFKSSTIKLAILFEVGLQKYPIIEGFQKLRGFKVKHQITFIDLKHLDQVDQLVESMKQYQNEILADPYKQELPFIYHEQEFLQNKKHVGPQEAFLYDFQEECWGDLQFHIKNSKTYRWVPCQLPNYGGNMSKFIQQWKICYIKLFRQLRASKLLQDQLAEYGNFQSASNIIDFLTQIDECKIKPTEQEREVISSNGNLMVIGRSGTGKTTCAILRLFSIHILVKYKAQFNNQRSDKLFQHSQKRNPLIGLHSLYTTQNQRLVQDVKKKYNQMLQNLRQASIEQNLSSKDDDSKKQSDQQDYVENNKLKDMILDELAQELRKAGYEAEKQVFKFTDYAEVDFPLFLSVKKLLFLIDNCLDYPFFQQQRFKNQDNLGDLAGWDDDDAMNNIKQEIQQQNNNQNNYMQMLEQNAQKVFQYGLNDQSLPKNTQYEQEQNQDKEGERIKFRNIRVVEVNYEIFRSQFWPRIQTKLRQKRDQNSLICLVWTQIYSYIKGSQYSHQYPGNYLPKDLYIKKLKSVLEIEKLEEIYCIFQTYEKWKDQRNYFDQMDIVNYLMNCLEKNQYNYNPIHNTLIDEVQDLPQSTIKLLKRLTEQCIYCSGDTAQSISKGVGFRFQDLRPILQETDFGDEKFLAKELISHQLTVNFRSHNKILQLANSIVNIIEIYFPKSIDKLRKEISDLKGPIPFVIESNQIQDLLLQLNNLAINGHDKVIIAKDKESKEAIPELISSNFICLTIAECKGLEFSDVIIWNFFCDQTISTEQWGQLNNITVETNLEDQDVYQSRVTCNQQYIIISSKPLTQLVKIKT